MIITSASNSRIKEVRRLKEKKEQKKSALFYMEGFRIIGEAFDTGSIVETLIVCPEKLKNEYGIGLLEKARAGGIEILEVTERVFETISLKENPQGLAALGRKKESHFSDLHIDKGVVLALNEIADAGNLGTIIRTADAVDCAGIILLGDTVSPYDTGAVRGSMGALFSQKIVRSTFAELLAWKQAQQFQMVGTSDQAEADYVEIAYRNPVILLMGSERQGLTDEQMRSCDAMARIPMLRSSDSLNLAVATGVMLYQIYNSHRAIR